MMNALDQAFIKAYSQQNPALAAAKPEPAKPASAPNKSTIVSVSVEKAQPIPAMHTASSVAHKVQSAGTKKGHSRRKGKSPGRLASESLFKAVEQSIGEEGTSKKRTGTRKSTSAKRTKSPRTRRKAMQFVRQSQKPRKTRKQIPKSFPPPAGKKPTSRDVIYRLDFPATKPGNDRPAVPAPHTDVIFSALDDLASKREPAQNPSDTTEPQASKNISAKKAAPSPENNTTAANPTGPKPPSEKLQPVPPTEEWAGDIARALSNFIEKPAVEEPAIEESDVPKTPGEIFAALASGMKRCVSLPVPLPEKTPAQRGVAVQNNSSLPEKAAAGEKKPYSSGMSARPEKDAYASRHGAAAVESARYSRNANAAGQNIAVAKSEAVDLPEETDALTPPPAPSIRLFQPMLQVDHFAWPKVCGRLETGADAELDRLIETLMAAQMRGKKVFVLGGCRSGDGATSLLLSAARRLTRQEVKVALVDADWSRPQLARRLGLLPQYGWEDVLQGRLPLEEVLIESIAERLVILPVREPFGPAELPAGAAGCLAETWDSLRHHFDVVLVDPGPLGNSPILDKQFVGSMAGRIDAAILVKNLRRQEHDDFDAACLTLNNAGMKVLGVVENFVAT